MQQTAQETKVEYLERNLSEVRFEIRQLENKPFGASILSEHERLSTLERTMSEELKELRPYSISKLGAEFLVAYEGMFIFEKDGSDWLRFASRSEAQAWIDCETSLPIAAQ